MGWLEVAGEGSVELRDNYPPPPGTTNGASWFDQAARRPLAVITDPVLLAAATAMSADGVHEPVGVLREKHFDDGPGGRSGGMGISFTNVVGMARSFGFVPADVRWAEFDGDGRCAHCHASPREIPDGDGGYRVERLLAVGEIPSPVDRMAGIVVEPPVLCETCLSGAAARQLGMVSAIEHARVRRMVAESAVAADDLAELRAALDSEREMTAGLRVSLNTAVEAQTAAERRYEAALLTAGGSKPGRAKEKASTGGAR